MQSASWNSFLTMAPPGTGRTHGAPPPHSGLTAHGHHGHPGGPPGGITAGAAHPVTVAQQHREREEREAMERERERDAREREQREREREREQHLAERLHRVEARDHVAAQQRAAYFANTAPPAQQVRFCVGARATYISYKSPLLNDLIYFFSSVFACFRFLDPRACPGKWSTRRRRRTRERRSRRCRSASTRNRRRWSGRCTARCQKPSRT